MFNKDYKDKEIEKILSSIVILIDSREKINSHIRLWLKSNKISFEVVKLDFGDYSFYIPKNEKLDIDEDIYFDKEITIERKANAEELSGNFTVDRDRLEREFERSDKRMRLLIENSSYSEICKGEYGTKFPSNSYIASLHTFQERYKTPFFFIDKEHSASYIYNTFKYYLRELLENKQN